MCDMYTFLLLLTRCIRNIAGVLVNGKEKFIKGTFITSFVYSYSEVKLHASRKETMTKTVTF